MASVDTLKRQIGLCEFVDGDQFSNLEVRNTWVYVGVCVLVCCLCVDVGVCVGGCRCGVWCVGVVCLYCVLVQHTLHSPHN